MDLPADPAEDDLHYVFDNRVRFAETDAQGVVFYGEYLTYQDETFSEFLRQLGFPHGRLAAAGVDVPVAHADVDYRAAATFDDQLTNGMRVASIGRSSIDFAWACRRRADDAVVATGHVTHVAVDADSGETTRVPEDFREAVRAFQDVAPDAD